MDIEYVKKGIIKGFFDFMNVIIKSIDSESATLDFGKKIGIADICKIEFFQKN